MLLRLPPELKTIVCKEASPGTLASLAQTSSQILPFAQSALFRHVSVDDRAARERFWIRRFHFRRTKHYDDITTYMLFRTAILSTTANLGALVVDLQISSVFQEITWEDLGTVFTAMPNLLRLRINMLDRGQDTEAVRELCKVSPRLQEFSSSTTLVCPAFVTFLEEHPRLTVWRHGTEQSSSIKKREPHSDIPTHILSRFTQYEHQVNVPIHSAPILLGMTNLTHLSLDFYIDSPLASENALLTLDEEFAKAIAECGTKLLYFAIGSLWCCRVGEDRFVWIMQNFVAQMPVLQYFQCGDWPQTELASETLDIVRRTVPTTLETFRLCFTFHDRRALQTQEGFTHAFDAAKHVPRYLPSVKNFIYRECCLALGSDGEWSRTSLDGDMWTPDWGYELI